MSNSATLATERQDVYQRVTDQIVAQLEAGTPPWAPRWSTSGHCGLPPMPRRSTGEFYRGINILNLWGAAQHHGFTQSRWMTFKQALEHGAAVRKGSKGSLVVYANKLIKEVEGDNGETEARAIPFMKGYTVFNVEQVDGLDPKWFDQPAPVVAGGNGEPIPHAEAFFEGVGARVQHGGDRAFYLPSTDTISLPPLAAFVDAEAYYATRAHETVHWTGEAARLDRKMGKRFGDEAYAGEELVAELGAAFICGSLGISAEPRADHAAYLGSWIKCLKADKRAIFAAATAAQAAADFIAARAEKLQLAA